jgi:hypothetical protein
MAVLFLPKRHANTRRHVTNLAKQRSQARSHLYKGYSIPITRLTRKNDGGLTNPNQLANAIPHIRKLFTLTALLSVRSGRPGAIGRTCRHVLAAEVSQQSNSTPPPPPQHSCAKRIAYPPSFLRFRLYSLCYFRNKGKLYAIFELTASCGVC